MSLLQVVEYCRAFLFGRLGWNPVNGVLVISGAFGVFHKETVIEVGGYRHSTIGEDMELVVRLHRVLSREGRPYSITFAPEPICWTEAPETPVSAAQPAHSLAARPLRKPVAESRAALQPARWLGRLGVVPVHAALRVSQPHRRVPWMGVFHRRLPAWSRRHGDCSRVPACQHRLRHSALGQFAVCSTRPRITPTRVRNRLSRSWRRPSSRTLAIASSPPTGG